MAKHSFIARLRRIVEPLQKLEPHDSVRLSVTGKFGTYELIIGPEYSLAQCRQQGLRYHSRPLQLSGHLPHLCIENRELHASPSARAINTQLQTATIIRDIHLQLHDLDGTGTQLHGPQRSSPPRLHIEDTMNFAGEPGLRELHRMHDSGELARVTYFIIQDDTLRALREEQRWTLQHIA